MSAVRGIGVSVPVVSMLALAFSQTFSDLFNQIFVFWGFFLLGLIAGLLIRAWWSVAVVPALLIGLIVTAVIARGDVSAGGSSEVDSLIGWVLLLAFNLILPSGVGAAVGAVVGSLIQSDEVC